ncbi:hypothetical protein QFZ66_002006 [Streptomyces sp. B4I13]|nr:hypothetical protein [Streptomyces sp. B4I13]
MHGLRLLALTGEHGNLIWVSAARRGRTHDMTAARYDRITAHLREAERRRLTAQEEANKLIARGRAANGHGFANLANRRILESHPAPRRAGGLRAASYTGNPWPRREAGDRPGPQREPNQPDAGVRTPQLSVTDPGHAFPACSSWKSSRTPQAPRGPRAGETRVPRAGGRRQRRQRRRPPTPNPPRSSRLHPPAAPTASRLFIRPPQALPLALSGVLHQRCGVLGDVRLQGARRSLVAGGRGTRRQLQRGQADILIRDG